MIEYKYEHHDMPLSHGFYVSMALYLFHTRESRTWKEAARKALIAQSNTGYLI